MATYIITSKSNSSFGTVAKAAGVKMTAKTVGKDSRFCFYNSLKNNLHVVVSEAGLRKFDHFIFACF